MSTSDGKILVHSRTSDESVALSGHNQEVNCLDSKDGLIISGSRDRTTRVRTLLQFRQTDIMSIVVLHYHLRFNSLWASLMSAIISTLFSLGTSDFSRFGLWPPAAPEAQSPCTTECGLLLLVLHWGKHLFTITNKEIDKSGYDCSQAHALTQGKWRPISISFHTDRLR